MNEGITQCSHGEERSGKTQTNFLAIRKQILSFPLVSKKKTFPCPWGQTLPAYRGEAGLEMGHTRGTGQHYLQRSNYYITSVKLQPQMLMQWWRISKSQMWDEKKHAQTSKAICLYLLVLVVSQIWPTVPNHRFSEIALAEGTTKKNNKHQLLGITEELFPGF